MKLHNKRLALASALLGTALLTAGATTTALWQASATTPGGTIVNGDISLRGDQAAYTRTSCTAGPITGDSTTDILSPGQTATWTQDFTSTFTGDNAAATLETAWSKAPSIPDAWEGTYTITNKADGTMLVAATPLGQPAKVENATVNREATYTATFTIKPKAGSEDTMLFGEQSGQTIDLTGLKVSITQKRSGEGFTQ